MELYWGTVKVYGFEEGENTILNAFVFANNEKEAKEKVQKYYDLLVEQSVIRKAHTYSFYVLEETDEEVLDNIIFSPIRATIFDSISKPSCDILGDMKKLYKVQTMK